jgi:hypothetical protein
MNNTFPRGPLFEEPRDGVSLECSPVRVEAFTPEECGWGRIGPHAWEKPDGSTYIFPPGAPELVLRHQGFIGRPDDE